MSQSWHELQVFVLAGAFIANDYLTTHPSSRPAEETGIQQGGRVARIYRLQRLCTRKLVNGSRSRSAHLNGRSLRVTKLNHRASRSMSCRCRLLLLPCCRWRCDASRGALHHPRHRRRIGAMPSGCARRGIPIRRWCQSCFHCRAVLSTTHCSNLLPKLPAAVE